MKKLLYLVIVVVFVLSLATGCSDNSTTETQNLNESTEAGHGLGDAKGNSLTLDLVGLDTATAYQVAHEITEDPENYIGSTIKVKGRYDVVRSHSTNELIHAAIIDGDNLCCTPVIEFELDDRYIYPDDFPKKDEEIEVEGVLKSYKEDGKTYYHLVNSALRIIR